MIKKVLEIAVLAAKNILTRGTIYFRARRVILMFGFPLYWVHHVAQEDFEESIRMDVPISMSEYILPYLVPLLILIVVSWLWQLFLCVSVNNIEELIMNSEEKLFVGFSLFLYACYFIFVDDVFFFKLSGFGSVFNSMFIIVSFGITIMGTVLITNADERLPVSLDLMLTTLLVAVTCLNMFLHMMNMHITIFDLTFGI